MPRSDDEGQSPTLPAPKPLPAGSTLTDAREEDGDAAAAVQGGLPVVAASSYTFLGELARGGMGRIMRATDRRLNRDVAIKEALSEHSDRASLRFEREAMLTAKLQHPNIVTIYEAGRWGTGQPFYAMRLVPGRSLSEVIRDTKSLDERLALLPNVLAATLALAYAHGEGIIHRDLKPHNILVGSFGETVVIDWGLAKRIGTTDEVESSDLDNTPDMTVAGAVVGTPAYMPPEQAAGHTVDERADVYALGAILYHLLAGRPPYRGDSAIGVLEQIAAAGPPALTDVIPGVPPDLATIVARAMERDPDRRYATARELATELQRYTTGQLVAAHRYSGWELLRRWVRRHVVAVTVAAIAAVALGVVGGASYVKIRDERDRADGERAAAVSAKNETRTMLGWSLAEQGRQEAIDGHAVRAMPYLVAALEILPEARSIRELITLARPDALRVRAVLAAESAPEAIALSGNGTLVTAAVDANAIVWDVSTGTQRAVLKGRGSHLVSIAFAADETVVAITRDGALLRWRTDGSRVDERLLWGRPLAPVEGIAFGTFAKDGATLATLRRRNQEELAWEDGVDLWDTATGARRATLVHGGALRYFTFADTHLVTTSGADGKVRLWSVLDGTLRREVRHSASEAHETAFSADGTRLATTGPDGVVRAWDVATGNRIAELAGNAGWVTQILWSRDGRTLISTTVDYTVAIWDVARQRIVARTHGTPLAATEDGHVLVADGRVAKLVSLSSGATDALFEGHDGKIQQAVVDEGRHRIVTASADATVRTWDAASPVGRIPASSQTRDLLVTPVTDRLLVLASDGTLAIHTAGADTPHIVKLGCEPRAINASPDGTMIVARECEGVTVRSLPDGAEVTHFPVTGDVRGLAFRADSHGLLVVLAHRIEVRDAAGALLLGVDEREAELDAAAVSSDGAWLAIGQADGALQLFDVKTRTARYTVHPHHTPFSALRFTRDGQRLVTGDNDGRVEVRNTSDGSLAMALRGHTSSISALRESRDGRRLITGSWDGTARIWDLATGAMTAALDHGVQIDTVQLSPDESTLVTASVPVFPPAVTAVWDVASGKPLVRVAATPGVLWNEHLVTAGNDELSVRDLAPYPGSATELRAEVGSRIPWILSNGTLTPRR